MWCCVHVVLVCKCVVWRRVVVLSCYLYIIIIVILLYYYTYINLTLDFLYPLLLLCCLCFYCVGEQFGGWHHIMQRLCKQKKKKTPLTDFVASEGCASFFGKSGYRPALESAVRGVYPPYRKYPLQSLFFF